MIPVRPVVHYMMGGVSTDIHGATPLAGLYAAGEVTLACGRDAWCQPVWGRTRCRSCWSSALEPAGLLPSSLQSTPEMMGHEAAVRSAGRRRNPQGLERDLDGRGENGGERISTGCARRCRTRWSKAPAFTAPAEARWLSVTDKLHELQERLGKVGVAGGPQQHLQHRADRRARIGATCSTSPSAWSTSAHNREESRGAHQRTDFPAGMTSISWPIHWSGATERDRTAGSIRR